MPTYSRTPAQCHERSTGRGIDLAAAARALSAFAADAKLIVDASRRRGTRSPHASAAADPALWVAALMRGSALLRAVVGSSMGTSAILRTVFHIDVWSDDIGPGLRLPHPFGIVIGEGVRIGAECTLMHHVTLQRSPLIPTTIGDGVVLGTGTVVLDGSSVGEGAIVGASSVVRGELPARFVAVGAPARVVRAVRAGESSR
jgi:serine acetyltransferase